MVGQEEAIKSLSQAIRRSRTGLKDPKKPIGSFVENLAYEAAKSVNEMTGIVPEILIEHGVPAECLFDLIRRDNDISILGLASGTARRGPDHWSRFLPAPSRPSR